MTFFGILESLLPLNSQHLLLEAVVYALGWCFNDIGSQYLKLEFLIKKYLGEGFFDDGCTLFDYYFAKKTKKDNTNQLAFIKEPNQVSNTKEEGLLLLKN